MWMDETIKTEYKYMWYEAVEWLGISPTQRVINVYKGIFQIPLHLFYILSFYKKISSSWNLEDKFPRVNIPLYRRRYKALEMLSTSGKKYCSFTEQVTVHLMAKN
jgi:hypothetical protein